MVLLKAPINSLLLAKSKKFFTVGKVSAKFGAT
jgi:hypothetical protein